MKKVKALFDHLNSARKFQDRYPLFNRDDKKIHILFLSPYMNESGYSRMILPALELNKTDSHCAIVANIHKWDFHKLFDDYDNPVDFQLVEWADYVVLPAMFSDASYIIESMKKINSDIDFVMDIDLNYHALPDYHPLTKTITAQAKATLFNNLSLVDLVTAPNNMIIQSYNDLATESTKEFDYYAENYPNLMSNFTYEEVSPILRNAGDKLRIGMLLDGSLPEDLATIETVLKDIYSQNKDKIDIVIYGWSEKITLRSKLLEGVTVSYEPIVNTIAFPVRLNELTFDIGLIPFVDNAFNRSGRPFNRYLDFSSVMVPCVMPGTAPFSKKITDGENGFLANTPEEWKVKISRLIDDAQLRNEIGQAAFQLGWQNYSYINPRSLRRLKEIFA